MVAGLNERELKQLAKAFTLLQDVDGSWPSWKISAPPMS